MIILIDGYNLLKTVLHVSYISDKQRHQFLQLLSAYLQIRTNNQIILVFDGGPDMYESEQLHQQISIIYAGNLQIADDVLKKKIYAMKSYDILLVTCDRDIRKYAATYHVESIGSVEFYAMLHDSMQRHEQKLSIVAQTICKTTDDSYEDLDRLMELGSRNLLVKDFNSVVTIRTRGVGTQFGNSKKDKKTVKKIIKI